MAQEANQPRVVENFCEMAEFLHKNEPKEQNEQNENEQKKKEFYAAINEHISKYSKEHLITTISVDRKEEFEKNDNSLETFLRRAVYDFFEKNELENVKISKDFDKEKYPFHFSLSGNSEYPRLLSIGTVKKIFENFKTNCLSKFDWKACKDAFDIVCRLCKYIQKSESEEENKIFPLDFIINAIGSSNGTYCRSDLEAVRPFVDTSSNSFIDKNESFLKDTIYRLFNKMDYEAIEFFLNDKDLVGALGGIEKLKGLLEIKKLEQSENTDAQKLARKLHDRVSKIDFSKAKIKNDNKKNKFNDNSGNNNEKNINHDGENTEQETRIEINEDEDYKREVKKWFILHQLPKSLASVFVFLFGLGLLFAARFAWSVPFLLGIGFIIPSIVAFINSILCMKATRSRTWFAKLFKNCAWILDGALLITLGAVFCAGPLAIGCTVFGSLSVLMGCFNAFVGTLNSMWNTQRELIDCENADFCASSINNIKTEILSHKIFTTLVFAVACAAGILLALNPAILPLALPFLPAIGIGIAVLSGLGLIKSALRIFFKDNYWQVGFYHVAKYIKAGMFVLGGLGLIALPFLPVTAALASLIGMPILVVNIFSFLVGLASAVKGCMSVTRMSSNIKFLFAYQTMDKAYVIKLPKKPINIEVWKKQLYYEVSEPRLKPGDINKVTCEKIFKE